MPRPALTYGCEIEMFQASSHVSSTLRMFREAGLCGHDRLHAYHCRCAQCTYDRPDGFLLAAQQDPSVGAEFITRILSNRKNKDIAEMKKLRTVFGEALASSGWIPDGVDNNGNHIHVGWPHNTSPTDIGRARSLMQGLFHAELPLWQESIATGGAPQVRGYNRPPAVSGHYDDDDGVGWSSGWLGMNAGTVELRLWNTPCDPDRLLVHPALSLALVHWALQIVDEEGDTRNFGSARDTAAWAADRARPSRKRIAKIVREIWQDTRTANLAAELIAA